MVIYLFKASCFLPLLLLLYFTVCGHARADSVASSSSGNNNVVLFEPEKITGVLGPSAAGNASLVGASAYYSPFLVATDDMMIAMVGVKRAGEAEKNIDIIIKYIKINEGWDKRAVGSNTNWNEQLAFQNTAVSSGQTRIVKGLLAVAKKDKLYLLLVNHTNPDSDSATPDLELRLVVGSVKNGESPKTIEWQENTSTVVNVSEEFKEKLKVHLSNHLFSGSAFLTKEGKIVFALVANDAGKTTTALIHSKSSETELEIVYKKIDDTCYPYYFLWEEKIIMVPVFCSPNSNEKIMESSNMAQQWDKSKTPLFQQYNFLKNKFEFVPVTIDKKNILLFMQHKEKISEKAGKKEYFLWIFDGTRASHVEVIDAIFDNTCYGSVFCTNNSLFALLSKCKKDHKNQSVVSEVSLVLLKEQLDNIRETLKAWDKSDKTVLALCKDIKNPNKLCTPSLLTAGLVGFLHNTTDGVTNKIWKDEYSYVNATVTGNGAAKTTDGFKFSGTGVGAKWEVGKKQPGEQPYNFTDPGFTLVATVTFDKNSKTNARNSVLGVVFKPIDADDDQSTKSVGLWCTINGEWGVTVGDGYQKASATTSNTKCEKGKTYNIALVLSKENNNNLEIYVNGIKLTFVDQQEIKIKKEENIKHFYFGADSKTHPSAETDVAITNVLLYNRLFTEEEIGELKLQQNKQSSTTTEDSALRVGVNVFFFLLAVFTLLGRYVY